MSNEHDMANQVLSNTISSLGGFEGIEGFEEVLTLFFDALPDPIFVIDEDGNFIKALGGNASYLYRGTEHFEGKCIKDIFSGSFAQKFQLAINEAITLNKLVIIEHEISPKELKAIDVDSSSSWFEGRVHPISQRGNDKRVVLCVTINKTESKLIEQKLLLLAETDPLTGAYNRRFFNNSLTRAIAEYTRYQNIFSILMIDVDHFKKLNDTFGHDIGDEVLKRLVNICNGVLRDIDIFSRYGGEEFMILLPNTSSKDACVVANRIRIALEKESLVIESKNIAYTVSVGVTEVKSVDENIEQLTKRVDLALYQAKESGRNQVCYN